jgi:large conductance mechanosensitive channel
MKGFRDFILRGNVVDLAVGVMVGAAFGTVVSALVKDLMTPFIAALVRQPNFSALTFTIRGSEIFYGDFLNALISFLIVAVTIYFFVVLPVNKLMTRFKGAPEAPKQGPEEKLLTEIRDLLKEKKGV